MKFTVAGQEKGDLLIWVAA